MEEVKGDVQTLTVFDGIFRESSFFRELLEQKIAHEVEKDKSEKDKQINDLKTQNENTVKELVDTKIENMQIKQQNEMIIKELADTKILLLDALNTINNIKNGVK